MEKASSLFLLVLVLSQVSAEVAFTVPFEGVRALLAEAATKIDIDEFNHFDEAQDMIFISPNDWGVWSAAPQVIDFTPFTKSDVVIYSSNNELSMWFFGNSLTFTFSWIAPDHDDIEGHTTVQLDFSLVFRFILEAGYDGRPQFTPTELKSYLSNVYASVHPTNNTEKTKFATKYFEDNINDVSKFFTSLFGAYNLVLAIVELLPEDIIKPIEGTKFAIDYSLLESPTYQYGEDWEEEIVIRTNGQIIVADDEEADEEEADEESPIEEVPESGEAPPARKGWTDITFRTLQVQSKRKGAHPADLKHLTKKQLSLLGLQAETTTEEETSEEETPEEEVPEEEVPEEEVPEEEAPEEEAPEEETPEEEAPEEEAPEEEALQDEESYDSEPVEEKPHLVVKVQISYDSLSSWDDILWQSPVTFAVFPHDLPEEYPALLNTKFLETYFPGLLHNFGEQTLFFVCHESDAGHYEPLCEFRSTTDGPLIEVYPNLYDVSSTRTSGWGLQRAKSYFSISSLIVRPYFELDTAVIDFEGVKEVLDLLFDSISDFTATREAGNAFDLPTYDFVELENINGYDSWGEFEVKATVSLPQEE